MNIVEKIFEYSLEEIMGDRFGRYSKYVIQDRAIPDVRDGLKPVQRRILYAMYRDKNTHDKAYRKSAKTVGNVIGNYHPHGDTSVYDAMVRMSQEWKNNHKYVEMHGNNGSMDGDSPAAMRYTEARLSKISLELLKDIDKNTVLFSPNYDDTELEPTVLPAKYPNLLVSGTTGISAGYATNIPPHNLNEICDACINLIDNPDMTIDEIINIVKGPDFPTGGIVEGLSGIKEAFTTGRGKVIVKCRLEVVKNNIIISEIPYEVNKANLVRKIDEIRVDKKIEGISEVRDETDKDGLSIVISLKKDANVDLILNYLYKNTDMQVSYNYNMISIVKRRPKLLGIIKILKAFINHQKEVVTKSKEFDLEHAKTRLHIVEGLIKALSILDEVIVIIRSSKNKKDAKDNLCEQYDFSEVQAEAIVMLQLYKLTNTDVTLLEEELANLNKIISALKHILNNEDVLLNVIKEELRLIKKEYGKERKSTIKEEISEIKIDNTLLIQKEDVIVVVTNDGYIKKVPKKSYLASKEEDTNLKVGDYVIGLYEINTINTVLLFTNLGNYLYVPVHIIPECKWKEIGKHISNVIDIKSDEIIVSAIPVYNFDDSKDILITTKNGMIKRSKLSDYQTVRYSKPSSTIKLKDDDIVISASLINDTNIGITTNKGYFLWYNIDEIPVVGVKAGGVKNINLKEDYVVSSNIFSGFEDYITIFTNKGSGKRVKLSSFTKGRRAGRGVSLIKEIKSNPIHILNSFICDIKEHVVFKNNEEINEVKISEIPIMDRVSGVSAIIKSNIEKVSIKTKLINSNDIIINNEEDNDESLIIDSEEIIFDFE